MATNTPDTPTEDLETPAGTAEFTLTALAALQRWVAWREEAGKNGKPTKVPYCASNRKASSTEPKAWLTHDEAVCVAKDIGSNGGKHGAGIVLGQCDEHWLAGIDLDTCRDPAAGTFLPWAEEVMARLASYTEISPSGTGAKVFFLVADEDVATVRALLSGKDGAKWSRASGKEHPPSIEFYMAGRYFTVTWQGVPSCPNELRLVPLADLQWLVATGQAFAGKAQQASGGAASDTDDSILARLRRAAQRDRSIATAINNAGLMVGGSRSEGAMGLGAALKRAGWSFDDMVAALRACPATQAWANDQGADGTRQFRRIWDNAKEEEQKKEPGPSSHAFAPKPWVYRDPKTMQPREWLVGNFLLRKYVTLLASPGGVGKTSLAIATALALITGRRDIINLHIFVPGCRVWLITLEDDREELEKRVAAAMIAHNVSPEDVAGRLFINDTSERPLLLAKTDESGAFEICADASQLTEGIIANKIDVTMIDPLVKSHAVIENSNEHMDKLGGLVGGIARDTNSSILLCAHTRKGGGEDGARDAIRGGGALVDCARVARTLVTTTAEAAKAMNIPAADAFRYIRMTDAKANLASKSAAQWFQLVQINLENGAVNPAYPGGDNVQAAKAWEPPTAFAGISGPLLSEIFDRLDEEPEPGVFYSPSKVGKHWAGTVVVEVAGKSEAQAKEVIAAWLESGVLTKQDYLTPKKNKRHRVVVNQKMVAEILASLGALDEDQM